MDIFSVYAMVYMHDPCVGKLDDIKSGRGESDRLIILTKCENIQGI
jgi:hypothetical protein